MTQEALAERTGVDLRTVRELESGERVRPPRVTTVRLLADALGLRPDLAAAYRSAALVRRHLPRGRSPARRVRQAGCGLQFRHPELQYHLSRVYLQNLGERRDALAERRQAPQNGRRWRRRSNPGRRCGFPSGAILSIAVAFLLFLSWISIATYLRIFRFMAGPSVPPMRGGCHRGRLSSYCRRRLGGRDACRTLEICAGPRASL
ncbi:helix-turn-helix transcriptional regulator [Streptomyces canarius]